MPLRLRSRPDGLPRISRNEFWSRHQLIRTVEPITAAAYRHQEDADWRDPEGDFGHGEKWHTSFHGSQYPGDNPNWCPRVSLYRMMNFVQKEPWSRRLRISSDVGKALEEMLVWRWHREGILLSPPPDQPQLRFHWPDLWLTGTADAVILPPGWNKPLPIEIKSKYQKELDKMLKGLRGPDPAHINQVKVEIAFTRACQEELWPELEPADHGVVFYMSRDDAEITAEYRVDYDPRFWEIGQNVLELTKQCFIGDVLPVSDNEKERKRHPMGAGWKWSQGACQYCDYKRDICRPDHKYDVRTLTESNGVRMTERIRGSYDAEQTRQDVLNRWDGKSGGPEPMPAEAQAVST